MVIIEMLLSFEKENVHEKRANKDIGYCPFYIYQSSSIVDQCGSAWCGGCALAEYAFAMIDMVDCVVQW